MTTIVLPGTSGMAVFVDEWVRGYFEQFGDSLYTQEVWPIFASSDFLQKIRNLRKVQSGAMHKLLLHGVDQTNGKTVLMGKAAKGSENNGRIQ